jgi:hypothetical protein
MKGRKTIEVQKVLDYVNNQLTRMIQATTKVI